MKKIGEKNPMHFTFYIDMLSLFFVKSHLPGMEDVLPFVESPVSPAFLYYAIMNHIVIIHVLACMLFCFASAFVCLWLEDFFAKECKERARNRPAGFDLPAGRFVN